MLCIAFYGGAISFLLFHCVAPVQHVSFDEGIFILRDDWDDRDDTTRELVVGEDACTITRSETAWRFGHEQLDTWRGVNGALAAFLSFFFLGAFPFSRVDFRFLIVSYL